MKRFLFSIFLATAVLFVTNAKGTGIVEQKMKQLSVSQKDLFRPLSPTYLSGAVVPSWASNWFIAISGGPSAFVGSPIGCEDLFGRIRPSIQIGIGKWHTPTLGTRLMFQGGDWKNGMLERQSYQHYHADFLLNLMSFFNNGENTNPWDFIPLIGIGIIDNRDKSHNPFAFNYGMQGRYRVIDRLHITAEISNTTTFKDADGYGSSREFGDHLLNFTVGVSWTFGRQVGWKKVIDARPYMLQNERLAAYAYASDEKNRELKYKYNRENEFVAELRKILALEGLLEKYSNLVESYNDTVGYFLNGYPVNDYSGLNSLRKRLGRNKNSSSRTEHKKNRSINKSLNDSIYNHIDSHHIQIQQYEDSLKIPIYFFFELGTAKLVDDSQLVNLDEITRIANKYKLKIEVTGAADSATGTEVINDSLGIMRTEFITNYLINKGISLENIFKHSEGGIDSYIPNKANRNAVVRLYLEKK